MDIVCNVVDKRFKIVAKACTSSYFRMQYKLGEGLHIGNRFISKTSVVTGWPLCFVEVALHDWLWAHRFVDDNLDIPAGYDLNRI